MGQYTDPSQANLTVGGNQFTNIQNYRRHEVRGTFSQFFDIGSKSHALKAGAGYEFGEEMFNRIANGWGTIANITQSGVPALRARYFTPQPPQLGQGAHLLDLRPGRRDASATRDIGECRPAAESRRVLAARGRQRRLPGDGRVARVARRFTNRTATRATSCGSVSATRSSRVWASAIRSASRKGRQGVRELGPLLQHGSEVERPQPRAEPHFPDADGLRSERQRPVERSARVDHREDDRSRHQADLHRRDPGRLCDAARRTATAWTCSSCRGG